MMEPRDNDRLRAMLTSEEAAEWFILTKDHRPLTTPRRRKYVRWLKQSPDNVAEALAVNDVYHLLRTFKLDPVPYSEQPPTNVVALGRGESRDRPVPPASLLAWKVAASVAVLLLTAVLLLLLRVGWTNPMIETDVGDWRTEELRDGSMIRLGPRTKLRIEFDDEQRAVHLLAGEAIFRVAKDAARPFIVSNELGSARALGTRFGVEHRDDRMVVTVAEGIVAVSHRGSHAKAALNAPAAGAMPSDITLSANQQVSIARMGLEPAQRVNAEHELAWARKMLIFERKTVAEIVAEFNRRNRTQIEIDEGIRGTTLVDGVFSAADPESFCGVLKAALALPITVRRVEPDVLRVELDRVQGTVQ